jgi:hypothetical protein
MNNSTPQTIEEEIIKHFEKWFKECELSEEEYFYRKTAEQEAYTAGFKKALELVAERKCCNNCFYEVKCIMCNYKPKQSELADGSVK